MDNRIEFENYLIPKIGVRAKKIREEYGWSQFKVSPANRSTLSKLEASGKKDFLKKSSANPATVSILKNIIEAVKLYGSIPITYEELIFGNEDEYKNILKFVFEEISLSIVSSEIIDDDVAFYFKYNDTYKEIRQILKRISLFNAELSLLEYDMMKDSFYDFPVRKNENEFFSSEEKKKYYLEKYKKCYENSMEYLWEKEKNRFIKSFKLFFITKNTLFEKKVITIGKELTTWINNDLYKLMEEIEEEYNNEVVVNIGFKINETTKDVLDVIELNQKYHTDMSKMIYEEKNKDLMFKGKKLNKTNINKIKNLISKELETKKSANLKIINVYDEFVNNLKNIQDESLNIKKTGFSLGN